MTMLSRAFLPVAAIALVASVRAQATLDVPGTYPEISDALAVALPGDLVVVQPGAYLPFDMTIGVTIVAPQDATVVSPTTCAHCYSYTTFNIPVGQTATIVGLQFASQAAVRPHVVTAIAGQVTFDRCRFSGGHPVKVFWGLRCDGADIVLNRCFLGCPHDCLRVDSGTVVATRCTMNAGANGDYDENGVEVRGGFVALSFCDIRGADFYSIAGDPGIHVYASVTQAPHILDCVVTGGNSLTGPCAGILNDSSVPVVHARSSVTGGLGHWQPSAPWLYHGPAFVGSEQENNELLAACGDVDGLSVGESFTGYLTGPANMLVVVGVSFSIVPPTPWAAATGPVRFDPAAINHFTVGLSTSYGVPYGTFVYSTGNLSTALFGREVWFHALGYKNGMLDVAPPVGGVVR